MKERSTTISGLFLRVEVQTEVVYFRQDASVKVVEMGDVCTLRPQCMHWIGKLNRLKMSYNPNGGEELRLFTAFGGKWMRN